MTFFVTPQHQFMIYISFMLIYAGAEYSHRIEHLPRWICVQDEFYLLLLEILHCKTRFKNHHYRKKSMRRFPQFALSSSAIEFPSPHKS